MFCSYLKYVMYTRLLVKTTKLLISTHRMLWKRPGIQKASSGQNVATTVVRNGGVPGPWAFSQRS